MGLNGSNKTPLSVWLSGIVVMALDLRLEIAGSISAAALSSVSLGKSFTHIAFVIKQYNLVPAGEYTGTPTADEIATHKDCRCLFCDSASATAHSSLSSALRHTVTGFVSRSASVGLW